MLLFDSPQLKGIKIYQKSFEDVYLDVKNLLDFTCLTLESRNCHQATVIKYLNFSNCYGHKNSHIFSIRFWVVSGHSDSRNISCVSWQTHDKSWSSKKSQTNCLWKSAWTIRPLADKSDSSALPLLGKPEICNCCQNLYHLPSTCMTSNIYDWNTSCLLHFVHFFIDVST